MSKFLFLFRGGDARMAELSPEKAQAHMQRWGTWMKGLSEKGKLEDGLPLGQQGKIVSKKGAVITDGPFAEGVEIVGGYLIVNADNLEEATEISKGSPILEYDTGSIEVRPISSM